MYGWRAAPDIRKAFPGDNHGPSEALGRRLRSARRKTGACFFGQKKNAESPDAKGGAALYLAPGVGPDGAAGLGGWARNPVSAVGWVVAAEMWFGFRCVAGLRGGLACGALGRWSRMLARQGAALRTGLRPPGMIYYYI